MSRIAELVVADEPARWRALGFAVDDGGTVQVGTVRVRLAGDGAGDGVVAWVLAGLPDESWTDVDGLPTTSGDPTPPSTAADHPIGVRSIDHVVVLTPELDRTVGAVERHLGLPLRRVRDGDAGGRPVRQAFFRMGEVVLEVVAGPSSPGDAPSGPARFYGLAFTVDDLDVACAQLGDEVVSEPKPAVQPGRRIATVRRAAGLRVPVALMSAGPR